MTKTDQDDLHIDEWRAEFSSPTTERAWRRLSWSDSANTIRIGLIVISLSIIVAVYGDRVFIESAQSQMLVLICRAIMLGLYGYLFWVLGDWRKRKQAETLLVPFLTVAVFFAFLVSLTRPPNYWFLTVQNLCLIYPIYLFTPVSLRRVSIVMVTGTLTYFTVAVLRGHFFGTEMIVLALTFFSANIFGFFTARSMNNYRRSGFANRIRERRARRKLLAEINMRKRVERQLIDAKRAADEANLAKSAFLAAMSHEIRTPLTGILGFAQLLSDTRLNAVQAAHVQVIERSGRDLTRLLNDILDLSKVEAGRIRIETAPFNVLELVDNTLRLIANRAKSSGVPILFHAPPEAEGLRLIGDQTRIRQILINTLDNALKFSALQPVELGLSVDPATDDVRLGFSIADRGPGIPEASKAAIFKPYFTTPNVGASGPGAGLGLAITKRLVEAMGGSIRVADREGGGTIFHIVLSLVRAIDHAPQALATLGQIAPADEIHPAAKSFHELNVLIVDDDEINQLLLVTLLTKMGHRVICAHDGRQAVKLASSQIFDLVLMDIRMPVLNGKDAIAELRSNSGPTTDGLPIFVMTANVMDQEVAQYREVGADQVLAKPIDFGQLRQLVATLEPRARPQSGFGASAHHTIDKAILGAMISLVGTQGAKRALRQMATTTPVLFQAFDHAVATGDEIARQRTVERLAQVLEAFGAKSLVERAIALTPATRIELEAEIHEAMTYLSGLLDEEVQRAFA